MFEVRETLSGVQYLKWVEKLRNGERGRWVVIGHENEKGIEYYVKTNREMGTPVLVDDAGYYRALVLRD